MADGGPKEPTKYPAVPQYGPFSVRDLKPGERKKWCTCGLSKKQPWCDGSHKKTGFHSVKWKVPDNPEPVYDICGCCSTKNAPFCDGTCRQPDFEKKVKERQATCMKKNEHPDCKKMCTACGWAADF